MTVYLRDSATGQDRFDVARVSLRRERWRCDESGDWCPTCDAAAPR
ncbi:hypothetical protein ACIBKY_03895 [Nonomuraea sp. NPDC050394]